MVTRGRQLYRYTYLEMDKEIIDFNQAYWSHINNRLYGSDNLYKDMWGANRKVRNAPKIQELRQTPCANLVPDYFSQPSELREGGYKMWDFILASHAQGHRKMGKPIRFSEVPQLKENSTNSYWFEDMWRSFAYQDSGGLDDVSSKCLNLVKMEEAFQLIDLAAQMAYLKGDRHYRKAVYWEDHACNSYYFAKAVAELSVAKILDLPLDLTKSNPLPYGIAVRPTLRMGFTPENAPILQEIITPGMSVDENLLYICAAIEPGPDPLSATTKSKVTTEECAWGYLPKKVIIAGWETAAWVTLSSYTSIDRIGWTSMEGSKSALSTHCSDLIQSASLPSAVKCVSYGVTLGDNYKPLDYWLTFDLNKARTEVVPVESCFLVNSSADSPLSHAPYYKKFIRMAKKGEKKSEDQEELEEYKHELFLAFNSVRKARREYLPDTYPGLDESKARRAARKEHLKQVRKKHLERNRRR